VKLLLSKSDIRYLTDSFPSVDFCLYQSNDLDRFISCFIATFPSGEDYPDAWLEITSLIAVNFQASLTNDHATWNIYLALVFPTQVSRHLKYKIESNRFSLRKIVLTLTQDNPETKDQVLEVIENMVLGSDLVIGPTSAEPASSPNSSFVREIVSSTSIIPADTKEKSILERRQYLTELLSRVSKP
jgi:hypothetical protein